MKKSSPYHILLKLVVLNVISCGTFFVSVPVAASESTCRSAFQADSGSVTFGADQANTLRSVLNAIDQGLQEGQRLPQWKDFDALDQLIKSLKTSRPSVNELDPSYLVSLKSEVTDKINLKQPNSYRPTERELLRHYYEKIIEFNSYFARDLRIKVPSLLPDSRSRTINREVREVMTSVQEQSARLIPTSGFQSLEDFRKKVMESGNEKLKENLELLEKGNFEFSMRRPVSARFWLPMVGFQNQFVTGSSGGYYTPIGRNNVETGWTGLTAEKYHNFDSETKPKYGSIRPKPGDTKSKPANSDRTYGTDIFILKMDQLKDRTTFNIGDSNGLVCCNTPGGWINRVHNATSWEQSFIPFSHRILLAPYLERDAFGDPQPTTFLKREWNDTFAYFEIQVFGPVSLEDVKALEFTSDPPAGDFLRELQARGIEIRDGRSWPPKPWTP